MQRMKNVTSAEDLLQLLRSGRERQDAPSLDPSSSCPFEPARSKAKELFLTEAALGTLHSSQTRMLDAALHLLEHPITVPQSLPLPGELLQSQMPLASLQADELIGAGFAPVSDWDRGQGSGNSAGDEQTGSEPFSEDTHQDALRVGANDGSSHGDAVRSVQVISGGTTTAVRKMMHKQQQQVQQQQTSGRPQRQTAKRALEKFGGSTHRSVADEDEEFNEDEFSDTEDFSDAYGKRMHLSSSGAQSFRRTAAASLNHTNSHGAGGAKGCNKHSGRPLKPKSYDALVDPTLPPEEIRRIRRVLSNRESARRSRKRKATQISALEDELMEVRMAATELENELIEALTKARAVEKEKSKLLEEVDMLREKVVALEAAAPSPVAGAEMGVKTIPVPTASGKAPAARAASAASVPITAPGKVVPVAPLNKEKEKQPPQMVERQLSVPLPPPIKIKLPAATAAKRSPTAPPVMPLPLHVASQPTAAPAAAGAAGDASIEDPLPIGKNASGGIPIRRASPNAHHTSSSSHQFRSPLRQGGTQVSHRVRFRPASSPNFFSDAPFEGNMDHKEDITHELLL